LNRKEIDISRLWRYPFFHHNRKNFLEKEILRWRTKITRGDDKTSLVTVLSYNMLEDKISIVLVPLLASAGLRILKPIWHDEFLGHALLNTLLSIPGMVLPTNLEDVGGLLEFTGGGYSYIPESATIIEEVMSCSGLDEITRFKMFCMFILYAIDWDGIAIDIRIGDYSDQMKARDAQELAMDLREHCDSARIGFSLFITSLRQPLGHALGPILELKEALDVLKAKGPLDFTKLAIEQGADLLMFAGRFTHRTQAKTFLKKQLQNGAALDKFKDIVEALGGSGEITDDLYPFPLARRNLKILSHKAGYIQQIAMDRLFDLKQRLCSEHKGAGLVLKKKIGDWTGQNDTLAQAYLPSSWDTQLIQAEVRDLFSISHFPPDFQPLIAEKIKGSFRF
jgi:pyrimidine-nucleoside phosphorylase